jgi:tetratricopeptide (TPR) repeat protein
LSENVLYEVGNFSPTDAKKIIQQLTERANFSLEPALVDELIKDLAGNSGEVRPIELQVVGAQLQAEKITTLEKYRECGTQEELVKRYLQEVVDDCGEENKKVAELVLYLLTDEKNTRPLKTRAELERDLKQLAADDSNKLDLVLQIFVKSGLVLLLPENPADRYQLVHDYLAAFIRRQQEPKLTQLMAELEKEKQQRKLSEQKLNRLLKSALVGSVAAGLVLAVLAVTAWDAARRAENQRKQAEISEIKALTNSSEASSTSGQTLNALGDGLKAAASLKKAAWATSDIQMRTMATLHEAVYIEPQEYPAIEVNTLEGHSSWVMSVVFSPDGKHIASGSADNTIKLWDVNSGKELKTLKGHSSWVMSVVFSPDGKHIASGSADNTVILWDLNLDNLVRDSCNLLNNYLIAHPETLEELEPCQTPERKLQAASVLVMQGQKLARKGDKNLAIDKFRKAQAWDSNLKFDLQAKAEKFYNQGLAETLVEEGENLAQKENYDGAVAKFQEALKLDSSLDFDPKEKAGQLVATVLIEKGQSLAKEGKVKDAIETYNKARKLDPKVDKNADSWERLCWYGSLRKQPTDVMFACEKAVKLAPKSGYNRDSRGVARAMTGNIQGAIEDFQAYIAETDDKDAKLRRQGWIRDLRAGKNPFTDEELKEL